MLLEHHFGQLLGADAVRAVGVAEQGEAGDITVAVDWTPDKQQDGPARAEELFSVTQGESSLAGLRKSLKTEFERSGNRHWGMETDLTHLARALNIGSWSLLTVCRGIKLNVW